MDPQLLTEVVLVTPGQLITKDSSQYLRGHGTYVTESGEMLASLCGVLERVNRLVTVVPLRARYIPRVGDVVVGRVTEVQPKRWLVDVNSLQDAGLNLNSINLPGGELRRRKDVDALNMRMMLEEEDVFSAEVLEAGEGPASLHTRSALYGKLGNGQLVVVRPSLVKRIKQHFVTLDIGVDLILGCNGYIWLSSTPPGSSHQAVVSFGDVVDGEQRSAARPPLHEDSAEDGGEGAAVPPPAEGEGEDAEELGPLLDGFATKRSNPNNPALPDAYAVPY
eukprot:RCo047583